MLFVGADSSYKAFVARFIGHHSTTQVELAALRLGFRRLPSLSSFRRLTFVCDSQSALLALMHSHTTSSLALNVRLSLQGLQATGLEIRLWWIPGHVGFYEHDLADIIAGQATRVAALTSDSVRIPLSRAVLQSIIRHHFISHMTSRWRLSDKGRELFQCVSSFSPSLCWTSSLDRREVALVAQFLCGHYPTNQYLHRFGLCDDISCPWCHAPMDDRSHRLLHCPRFESFRQLLSSQIYHDSDGRCGWSWDYLVHADRPYLARFLKFVRTVSRSGV